MIQFYPLRFQPILKREIWGGRRLGDLLGKRIGPESDYAESWEIADHGADCSIVAEGPLAGESIQDLLQQHPAAMLGDRQTPNAERRTPNASFPLLIKFL